MAKFFFPQFSSKFLNKLKFGNDEAYYSATPLYQVFQIKKIFKKLNISTNNSSFVDATANIGASTINFACVFKFKKIISIEINPDTFKILKHNICIFFLNFPNNPTKILLFNNSFLNFNFNKFDFIFIDPPWGGPDYKKKDKVDLFIDNINIKKIVSKLFFFFNFIFLKVPINFNFFYFKYKYFPITSKNKSKISWLFVVIPTSSI